MRRFAPLLALAVLLGAGPAWAEPSIWARARRGNDEERRARLAEAEALQLKYHRLTSARREPSLGREEVAVLAGMYLLRSAQLLEEAGAGVSPDPFVRLELADVYGLLGRHAESAAVLERVIRADPPAVLRARAWASVAVAYAHLGRTQDEIDAYGQALTQQPLARERARLLANRAEAYMLLGDITAAVEGYRAALAMLSSDYLLFGAGPTTLWGLAVALDRGGDLDGGLEAVRLARSYDPRDQQISGPGWFYVPDYDRHWYAALGHWAVARKADVPAVQAEAYARAVAEIEAFVTSAAPDDKWLPLARVRRRQCEKERAEFHKREQARRATAQPLGAEELRRAEEKLRRLRERAERELDGDQQKLMLEALKQAEDELHRRGAGKKGP
jgi:tetratricopeptide (TPR) repeat protein